MKPFRHLVQNHVSLHLFRMKSGTTHLSRLGRHAATIMSGSAAEQFGALCVRTGTDGLDVLLITTRETRRWSIPKGWPIRGLSSHEVVEREAWEEAGVKGRAKKRVFGYYTYLKTLDDGRKIPSIVEVHLVSVRRMKKNFPECKERKLAWMRPREAALLVDEPELKSLIRSLDWHRTLTSPVAGKANSALHPVARVLREK